MEQSEAIRRIGQAKAVIDNGLCRVGPRLSPESLSEGLLTGGAGRAIALSDAVVQLCRHDHPTEALPVLRQLAETAAAMAWAARGGDERARTLLAEAESGGWEGLWPADRLRSRAAEAGLPAGDVESVESAAAEFLRGARQGAPWSHVFAGNRLPGADSSRVLKQTVRWMEHALRALDARWPGVFAWEP